MRQKACMLHNAPSSMLKPPPLRKFHLKFAHDCMAFWFFNDPPLTPPRCTTSWLYPGVAQISFEICTMIPPWTTSPLRKIHVHPLRKIHVPPHCARSMSPHCAISMSPQLRKIHAPPLKHAHYMSKSMEADHCRVVPTGRGKTRNTTIYHGTKYEDANSY